ncbi:unannotated protein [freshwater metagenome]|uniref:Unannotated protein n=1 Tax=freshwater metagenome TaxID=449393 RepID=A0A6J7JRJ6_9ZZZZ
MAISPKRLLHLARSLRQLPYLRANSRAITPSVQRKLLLSILRRNRLVNQPVAIESTTPLTIDKLGFLGFYKGSFDGPLVSVIMPVYNSAKFLETAISGVLGQSYKNLELIIVDDASTDTSKAVAKKAAKQDARVRVLSVSKNGGAYAARNLALANATGEFVTVHDADDWSHPKKLEVQALDLIENSRHIANTSEGVRVASKPGNSFEYFPVRGRQFIRPNISSLMFRRAEVVEALGNWDEVRFGGDSEFAERMAAVFGADSVVNLKTGPLSFTRVHAGSLTSSQGSSTHLGIRGARRFYIQRYNLWHAEIAAGRASGHLGAKSAGRPFFLPQQLTDRVVKHPAFESVLVADLTKEGQTSLVSKAKKPLALLHTTPLTSTESIASDLLPFVDFDKIVILFEGEKAKVRRKGGRDFDQIDTSFNG